ncbi:hypothetical protein GCM10025866_18080 [Naasia aerilata]|uniref:Uncharacterized protein n=1 Tax=Naasia aerilata TaxID=1162966 RepID=A0ABM8GCD8_9MICO|nr:DUF6541 family protein [Naasia aerilata]BDZ45899.1 hypothetical protein GCM10025866_18080 [Naasia aerilata]
MAVVTPEWRWAAVAWLLVAALYCLAAGSNSDFAKLATGIWYKDKYRLISLLPVILVPLAAAALARYAGAAATAGRARRTAGAAGLALLTAGILAAAWFGPSLTQTRAAIATVYEVPDGPKDGALLNRDELDLLERLPELTPKDAVVVGNPWNGSTLSWAVGDREPLFPHLTGDWGADRLTVANGLDQLAANPEVCAALGRLGAEYLFVAPGLLWNGDPQAGAFAAIDRTDPAAIGEEVAREGDAALYRITACG